MALRSFPASTPSAHSSAVSFLRSWKTMMEKVFIQMPFQDNMLNPLCNQAAQD
jgi:hypothetical protein